MKYILTNKVPYKLIFIFLILTICIWATGYVFYQKQKNIIKYNSLENLNAIAELKAEQITNWRKEILSDALIIYNNPTIASEIEYLTSKAPGIPSKKNFYYFLESILNLHQYQSIFLVDKNNNIIFSVSNIKETLGQGAKDLIKESIKSRKIILSDLYYNKALNTIRLTLVIPVFSLKINVPAGIFILRINPHTFLYPLIQKWPTKSRTSETVLFRRENENVVFLNELRHRKDTALKLRFSIKETQLPEAMALRGVKGIAEGIDYRGNPVIAVIKQIPDSPWFIVAKTDKEEIYEPVKKLFWIVTVIVTILITGTGIFFCLIWRQNNILRDMEEHKRAEEALKKSEEKYRAIFENTGNATFIIEADTKIALINSEVEKLTGYSTSEIIGKSWTEFIPVEELDKLRKFHDLRRIQPDAVPRNYETRIKIKSGDIKDVVVTAAMITDSGQSIVSLLDITDWKKSEIEKENLYKQLLQAQKMEAIGQFAGGIAHDFNNILTAVTTYAYFLKMKLGEDNPLINYAKNILDLSDKAANLTKNLLAFSKKQIMNPVPVNVNEIIIHMKNILMRIIGEDIIFKTILKETELFIMADPGQIEQVLMNLATNAKDAMPDGGQLIIETDILQMDNEFIKSHGYGKQGDYVVITITDTGIGMDENTRQRIFEPFFTTKEVGKGTGLGLAIVYGIIKQHKGFINVYSEKGKGSTFRIYLPLISIKDVKLVERIFTEHEKGTGTLLLVEDEDDVRNSLTEMLEDFGYDILTAKNGKEAIELFSENKDKILLCIIDLIMPGLNGKETFIEIKKIKGDAKAIFLSGYTADIIHRKGLLDEGLEFLSKPVTPSLLSHKIKEVIQKNNG